jgi:integrase
LAVARATKSPRKGTKGNVWQGDDGRWQWEVTLIRQDGTEYRKHGARKTEALARQSRDKAFSEFNRTEGANSKGWTIRTWSEYCIADVWPNELAETTVDAYRHWLTTKVYSKLGSMRIDEVTVPVLQRFFNELKKEKTQHTATRTRVALSSALTRATQQGLIDINPCRSVSLKDLNVIDDEDDDEGKRILTPDESDALLKAAEGSYMLLPIALGLKCGLRFGECLGLEWRHCDLDEDIIRVRQQHQNVNGKGLTLRPPKTKAGKRDLSIPPSLKAMLIEARARDQAAGIKWVCHREGTPFSSQNGSTYFKAVAIKAGLDGSDEKSVPTHHDCRSTFLTFLANHANDGRGVKPHVLMKIAGHSKMETTMKYYIRASDADIKAAMSSID